MRGEQILTFLSAEELQFIIKLDSHRKSIVRAADFFLMSRFSCAKSVSMEISTRVLIQSPFSVVQVVVHSMEY